MLRLDYVSPLPPVRSGIADYSADLLPHLAPLCDLRVIGVPGQKVAAEIAERWSPVAAAEMAGSGRLALYHMGNNRHHERVLELALAHPGVVALHDLVLHHLLIEATLGKEEKLEPYQERLRADHGWVGDVAARARQWGELGRAPMFELPANRTLLRRQRGVLVHSRWAAERLAEEDPELAVRHVPMAMPLPARLDEESGRALRRRLGVPLAAPLLGSFGFQTPIKRTDVVVGALARPELAGVHLLIAGELSPALDVVAQARELGVARRVHVAGFLPYDEFEAAIAACDLCVNLRYPTAGETSASLLRVLAAGRAALVSDYAQFAELSDEAVLKVPLGEGETAALAAAAGRLLADRAALTAMGGAAREYVARRHDPATAARRMVAACAELAAREPPGDAAATEPAPSTLTWRILPGELTVAGWSEEWPVGARRRLSIELANTGLARWLATRHDPGGVLVELQWRDEAWGRTLAQSWVELPTDLDPGERRTLATELRRPPGAGALIVEPHVKGIAGFDKLGGPRQILELGRAERGPAASC
ncbi:MAG: glycosyltransferase [Acidobacteriota bacterium]|nr:glycosyltransferase [Acidobacteriota bacterium]MDH3524353.1 glycosyltransferase [Acidobacteriota bacterium]